jgi:hypothetical protein
LQRTAQDVSKTQADQLKLVWEGEGATVDVTPNTDGTFNLTGTWPDTDAGSSSTGADS